MEQKRTESGAKSNSNQNIGLDVNATAHLNKSNVLPTNDSFKYSLNKINAVIKAIWNGNNFVEEIKPNELVGIVLDKSNFYAEQGGQIFDIGNISLVTNNSNDQNIFTVENVQTFAGYVLHIGKLNSGSMKLENSVELSVDLERRNPIMSNHTFTHILNFALRSVLGNGVDQKGSLVDHEKLRFDFSHSKSLSVDELKQVEDICNEKIKASLSVYSLSVPFANAKKINGIFLFIIFFFIYFYYFLFFVLFFIIFFIYFINFFLFIILFIFIYLLFIIFFFIFYFFYLFNYL